MPTGIVPIREHTRSGARTPPTWSFLLVRSPRKAGGVGNRASQMQQAHFFTAPANRLSHFSTNAYDNFYLPQASKKSTTQPTQPNQQPNQPPCLSKTITTDPNAVFPLCRGRSSTRITSTTNLPFVKCRVLPAPNKAERASRCTSREKAHFLYCL